MVGFLLRLTSFLSERCTTRSVRPMLCITEVRRGTRNLGDVILRYVSGKVEHTSALLTLQMGKRKQSDMIER